MAPTTITEESTEFTSDMGTESREMLERLLASNDERRKKTIHTTLETLETVRLMEAEQGGVS